MIKILNEQVALKPLVFEHDKAQGQKLVAGFSGTDKLSRSIITSEVIFSSKSFKPGQKVFLRAEVYNIPQAKNVMKIEETEFILIPESMVVAVNE